MLVPVTWLTLVLAGCFWISEADRTARFDLDGDGVLRPDDCDDDDPTLSAVADYYADADGDGFGDPATATAACAPPEGYVADATDCDDSRADAFPGAPEQCNTADDDCDGLVDEDAAVVPYYPDADNDGAGDADAQPLYDCRRPAGYVSRNDDCDDLDPDISPLADEVCNGEDDDCDGDIDLDDPDLDEADATWYRDGDGDGVGDSSNTLVSCEPPDGYADEGGDCRDDDPDIYPGADERCNGLDDDCDLLADEDAVDAGRWYVDADEDGFGDVSQPIDSCFQPPGTVSNAGDCDDDNPLGYPGAPEICGNGLNDDCDDDNEVDEADCVPPPVDTSDTSDTGSVAGGTGSTGTTGSTGDTGP
jgi:hypothetical protein